MIFEIIFFKIFVFLVVFGLYLFIILLKIKGFNFFVGLNNLKFIIFIIFDIIVVVLKIIIVIFNILFNFFELFILVIVDDMLKNIIGIKIVNIKFKNKFLRGLNILVFFFILSLIYFLIIIVINKIKDDL